VLVVDLEPHAQEVLGVVQDVAASPLEGGRARITIEHDPRPDYPAWFDLVPEDPQACPVTVQPDYSAQVSLFLGPPGATATLEIWDEDRACVLETIREVLTAVVEGRYEQKVKATGRKHRSIRVRGVFDFDGGRSKHSYAGPTTADLGDSKWHTRRFVAY
jgi:hypothetical protein